jgi:hypothetical protein
MTSLAECLKIELLQRKESSVWAGDPDLCISAYLRFGGKVKHPLNRIKATLAAARRSDLFVRDGYIRACDSSGTREILHPVFKLKAQEENMPQSTLSTYAELIKQVFDSRTDEDRKIDQQHKAPGFVVKTCKALVDQLHKDGYTAITLDDMFILERTCTGADYHEKLALRCFELFQRTA